MNENSDIGRARRRSLVAPAASLTGALAAALVPQTADAALITVGGDGGTGTVTLENPGDTTDLGGLLRAPINYFTVTFSTLAGLWISDRRNGDLYSAVRSSVSSSGNQVGILWAFRRNGATDEGALLDSADNWVPGRFRVNGVNDGRLIWGWLQVRLGAGPGSYNPTILSFTYDDQATDDTPFAKPIGGFSLTGTETDPVPEPGTLGLLGLGLGAAFVSRMRRRNGR